jgi:hypothetical protein
MNSLKEIHEQRRKKLIETKYKDLIYFETCENYWYHKQQNILDFIQDHSKQWKNKNILLLNDDTGLCSIVLYHFGASIFAKYTNDLMINNIELLKSKINIYQNESLDFIIDVQDHFIMPEELKDDTKLLIAPPKILHSNLYSIRQITSYRSGKNTLFEIQKVKKSWLDKFNKK